MSVKSRGNAKATRGARKEEDQDCTNYEPLECCPEQEEEEGSIRDAAKGMPRGSESPKLCHEGGRRMAESPSSDELKCN